MLNITRQIVSTSNHLTTNSLNLHLGSLTQVRFKNRVYIPRPKPPPVIKYEALQQSFKAKGYLRAQEPYTPPKNVAAIIEKLRSDTDLATGFKGKVFTLEDKFNFLAVCSKEFNHTVPNSLLHEMDTIDDVIDFYETPINTFLPLDELMTRELPPNLHIENKYHRFNPESDTMFGGKSAFPESSTIVTGIKYRQKYAGYKAPVKPIED